MKGALIGRMAPFLQLGLLSCLCCCSLLLSRAHAQQQETNLIQADSSWGKEVFSFPLSFAPEIQYRGFEEAFFPKGWSKKDSAAFWSYVFAWRIETQHPLTGTDLEKNLKLYFDGLMSANAGLPKDKLPETVTLFLLDSSRGNRSDFKGNIRIYDAFTLKAPLALFVTVEQYFCPGHFRSILLFRFSPKPAEHPIWKRLNELTIRNTILVEDKCL
jgi:hypothetical protein